MIYWLGAIALLPVALWHGPAIVADVVQNPGPAAMLIISVVVAEFFIIWSIQLLGGVDAGLVEISYPLWTMLFLYLLKDQKPSVETIAGAVLVGAGLLLLARK
jgi:drug/metabolite transporter (DMT)-like permease